MWLSIRPGCAVSKPPPKAALQLQTTNLRTHKDSQDRTIKAFTLMIRILTTQLGRSMNYALFVSGPLHGKSFKILRRMNHTG